MKTRLLCLALVSAGGCASSTGASPVAAGIGLYRDGRLAEARGHLTALTEDDLSAADWGRVQAILAEIDAATTRAVPRLLALALAAETERAAGRAGERRAVTYYRAALDLMAPRDPARATASAALVRLDGILEKKRTLLEQRQGSLEALVSVWDLGAIADVLRQIDELATALGAPSPAMAHAFALARRFEEAGRSDGATALSELARELWRPTTAVPVAEEIRMALAGVGAQAPQAVSAAAGEERRSGEREGGATAKPAATKKPPPQDPVAGEVAALIAGLRARFARGERAAAILALDAVASRFGDAPNRGRIRALQKEWKGARTEEAGALVAKGEEAMRAEKPDAAYDFYKRAAALDPENTLAHQRLRQLETLREIQGGGK